MNSCDAAYKDFFKDREMVESLLRGFVSESFVEELDFSTLEPCAASYVADDLRERMDDCVWKVRWRGRISYLCLILEFQSAPDPWMPVRILGYTALLWQDLIKTKSVSAGECLPPVFPIVIYNGLGTWKAPTSVEELSSPVPESLKPFQPRQSYFLLDEKRCGEEQLANEENLFSYIVRLERVERLEHLSSILKELKKRLASPNYQHLRRLFAVWIGRVVFKRAGITKEVPEFKDLQEVNAMLAERAATWKDLYIQEGLAQGRTEGLNEGLLKGRTEGLNEGLLKGRTEGLNEGLAQGRVKALAESVRAMTKAFGISEDRAFEILNVSEEERKAIVPLLRQ